MFDVTKHSLWEAWYVFWNVIYFTVFLNIEIFLNIIASSNQFRCCIYSIGCVVNEPSAAFRIVKCNLDSTAKTILPDKNKTTRLSVLPHKHIQILQNNVSGLLFPKKMRFYIYLYLYRIFEICKRLPDVNSSVLKGTSAPTLGWIVLI